MSPEEPAERRALSRRSFRLGVVHAVRAGDIVVIPAGVPHSQRNTGDSIAEIRAVFPRVRLDIEYLERNPAPGTEGDKPQPPFAIDTHTGEVAPVTS